MGNHHGDTAHDATRVSSVGSMANSVARSFKAAVICTTVLASAVLSGELKQLQPLQNGGGALRSAGEPASGVWNRLGDAAGASQPDSDSSQDISELAAEATEDELARADEIAGKQTIATAEYDEEQQRQIAA